MVEDAVAVALLVKALRTGESLDLPSYIPTDESDTIGLDLLSSPFEA